MIKTVEFGSKEVELAANGATPYRYKQVFGEDLLLYFTGKRSEEDQTLMVPRLAYIMALQAQDGTDFRKITEDSFLEWLAQFEATDLTGPSAASKVMGVYIANTQTVVAAKKNKGKPSE